MDTFEWTILTYETSKGEKPVDEFIKKQQPQGRSKIAHHVRLLRQYGNMLGMPHSKALGGGLYELRIRGKEELRIFYTTYAFILRARLIKPSREVLDKLEQ